MGERDHSEEQRAGSERPHRKHTDAGLPPIVDGRRLLPNHLVPGYELTADDIGHLRELLDFHYQWLAFYEKLKKDTERELDDQFLYMHELQSTVRAPVTGYVLQDGRSKGVYGDGWAAPIVELHIRPLKPVDKFLIRGWRPPKPMQSRSMRLSIPNRFFMLWLEREALKLGLIVKNPLRKVSPFDLNAARFRYQRKTAI